MRFVKPIIPQSVLDAGYRKQVHVEGWSRGAAFHYIKTVNGVHELVTPKNRKPYKTSNNLLYTTKNIPKPLKLLMEKEYQENVRKLLT